MWGRRTVLTRAGQPGKRTAPYSGSRLRRTAQAGLTHYSGFMAAAAARSVAPSRLCSASCSKMVAAPPQRPRPRRAAANIPDWDLAALLLGTCSLLTLSNTLRGAGVNRGAQPSSSPLRIAFWGL